MKDSNSRRRRRKKYIKKVKKTRARPMQNILIYKGENIFDSAYGDRVEMVRGN
jgi:hypothetical protein